MQNPSPLARHRVKLLMFVLNKDQERVFLINDCEMSGTRHRVDEQGDIYSPRLGFQELCNKAILDTVSFSLSFN